MKLITLKDTMDNEQTQAIEDNYLNWNMDFNDEENQTFLPPQKYQEELLYLIQNPSKIQYFDLEMQHDIDFVLEAMIYNSLVIDYLDEYMLNNKEFFLKLTQKPQNACFVLKLGNEIATDGKFLAQLVNQNNTCLNYFTTSMNLTYKTELSRINHAKEKEQER